MQKPCQLGVARKLLKLLGGQLSGSYARARMRATLPPVTVSRVPERLAASRLCRLREALALPTSGLCPHEGTFGPNEFRDVC